MPKNTTRSSGNSSGEPSNESHTRKAKDSGDLYTIEVLDVKGNSALVQYYKQDIPYRAYVDVADITDEGEVPAARLSDVPYGIDWGQVLEIDEDQLKREIEQTRLNLVQADLARRSLTRLTPRVLGLVMILSLTAIALVTFAIGRSLTRPIERLTAGMARYAQGAL